MTTAYYSAKMIPATATQPTRLQVINRETGNKRYYMADVNKSAFRNFQYLYEGNPFATVTFLFYDLGLDAAIHRVDMADNHG